MMHTSISSNLWDSVISTVDDWWFLQWSFSGKTYKHTFSLVQCDTSACQSSKSTSWTTLFKSLLFSKVSFDSWFKAWTEISLVLFAFYGRVFCLFLYVCWSFLFILLANHKITTTTTDVCVQQQTNLKSCTKYTLHLVAFVFVLLAYQHLKELIQNCASFSSQLPEIYEG